MSQLLSQPVPPDFKAVPANVLNSLKHAFAAAHQTLDETSRLLALYTESDLADAFGGAETVAEVTRLRTILANAVGQTNAPVPSAKELKAAEKAAKEAAEQAAEGENAKGKK